MDLFLKRTYGCGSTSHIGLLQKNLPYPFWDYRNRVSDELNHNTKDPYPNHGRPTKDGDSNTCLSAPRPSQNGRVPARHMSTPIPPMVYCESDQDDMNTDDVSADLERLIGDLSAIENQCVLDPDMSRFSGRGDSLDMSRCSGSDGFNVHGNQSILSEIPPCSTDEPDKLSLLLKQIDGINLNQSFQSVWDWLGTHNELLKCSNGDITNSEICKRKVQNSSRKIAVDIPAFAIMLFLREDDVVGGTRAEKLEEQLSCSPWRFHHSDCVSRGRIQAYPFSSSSYYTVSDDYPLCAVRQVHFGKEHLRFLLYATPENWSDMINFYTILLGQEPYRCTGDFCLFETGSFDQLDVQLALKKSPNNVMPKTTRGAMPVVKITDVGNLVPLLPNPCEKIADKHWQTTDTDGNIIVLSVCSKPTESTAVRTNNKQTEMAPVRNYNESVRKYNIVSEPARKYNVVSEPIRNYNVVSSPVTLQPSPKPPVPVRIPKRVQEKPVPQPAEFSDSSDISSCRSKSSNAKPRKVRISKFKNLLHLNFDDSDQISSANTDYSIFDFRDRWHDPSRDSDTEVSLAPSTTTDLESDTTLRSDSSGASSNQLYRLRPGIKSQVDVGLLSSRMNPSKTAVHGTDSGYGSNVTETLSTQSQAEVDEYSINRQRTRNLSSDLGFYI